MASSSKKRQTFAKMTRERAVREKRELKLEKKRAAAEARRLGITPEEQATLGADVADDETTPQNETYQETGQSGSQPSP